MSQIHRIALVTSFARSLSKFRGPLVHQLAALGHQVFVLAPDHDDESRAAMQAAGATPVDYRLSRTGMNPLADLSATVALARLLRALRPELLLTCMAKPVIYGSLAGTLARVPQRFAMIEGLGYAWTDTGQKPGPRRRLLRWVQAQLYRRTLPLNERVLLLNDDDQRELDEIGALRPGQALRIDGIGVDLADYPEAAPVTDPVTFLFIGRLLEEKGIREFQAAARLLRPDWPQARFVMLGQPDNRPGAVNEATIRAWADQGLVEWPGFVPDVREWLTRASVFVLPSWGGEGLPRSTQEAMAMGRAVLTTDVTGCRATVEEGRNGFLVPPRDSLALAARMRSFLEQPGLIASMGRASRQIAEQRFDVVRINDQICAAMGLGPGAAPAEQRHHAA